MYFESFIWFSGCGEFEFAVETSSHYCAWIRASTGDHVSHLHMQFS